MKECTPTLSLFPNKTKPTMESLYGLSVRKATPEEKNQDNHHAGFGSTQLQDSEARHKTFRLIRGLHSSSNTGASTEVED